MLYDHREGRLLVLQQQRSKVELSSPPYSRIRRRPRFWPFSLVHPTFRHASASQVPPIPFLGDPTFSVPPSIRFSRGSQTQIPPGRRDRSFKNPLLFRLLARSPLHALPFSGKSESPFVKSLRQPFHRGHAELYLSGYRGEKFSGL